MATEQDLRLHIHNDVELLTAYPLAFTAGAEGYVMQQDRVVYIGRLREIEPWVSARNGTYCASIYPPGGSSPTNRLKKCTSIG